MALWALCAALLAAGPAAAQPLPILPGGKAAAPAAPALPEELSPEMVDGLLARLTDAEIRALLREELRARAEDQANADPNPMSSFAALRARLVQMRDRIQRRFDNWVTGMSRLDQRGPQIERRLALAQSGVPMMLLTAFGILLASALAALAVHFLTRRWRNWLKASDGASYWDRVVRTLALTVVELAPVLVFGGVLNGLAAMERPTLGPLWGGGISYVWIFNEGVTNGWAAIVLSRRAFAPFAPQLRIADVSDEAAREIHQLIRRAAFVGMGGWLLAGLFPTFGLGFAPALMFVTLSGAGVFAILLWALARNFSAFEASCARVLGMSEPAVAGIGGAAPSEGGDRDASAAAGTGSSPPLGGPGAGPEPAQALAASGGAIGTPGAPPSAAPSAGPDAQPGAPGGTGALPAAAAPPSGEATTKPEPVGAQPLAASGGVVTAKAAASPSPPAAPVPGSQTAPALPDASSLAPSSTPPSAPLSAPPSTPSSAPGPASTVVGAPDATAPLSLEDVDDLLEEPVEIERRKPSATAQILRSAAPWAVAGYLAFAFLYWLARWLETAQQHLVGPLGTVLVGLALPALDRLGDELARALLRTRDVETAARFHRVLLGGWRVLLALVAAEVVAALWGFSLLELAKGPDAPGWASAAFDIGVALLLGQLAWRLIQAALYQERHVAGGDLEDLNEAVDGPSRLNTLIPMFRIFLLIVLSVVVLMIVLSSLGISIGPLLASAGIVGIAIGFGAQTLVRDIFSGMFFLIDDAFRVGEYIELDQELRGEVEAISIRSLQLRHHRGSIITIPFGELKNVTNHSRDWVIYKMSFRLEPDTDPAQVKKIVKRVGFALLEDPEHGHKFLEPLKSQGVFQIDDDSALIIRVKFKAKPRTQFVLRREVYHRLRVAFADQDIRFARKKVEVVSTDPAAAAAGAAATGAEDGKPGGLAQAANAL